jgi:hypothetical protein
MGGGTNAGECSSTAVLAEDDRGFYCRKLCGVSDYGRLVAGFCPMFREFAIELSGRSAEFSAIVIASRLALQLP